MIHVGIDLHTRNMTLAAVNDNGDLLKMECIPCCKLQLGQFFASIDEPVQAVVECTSSWYWLDDWFREQRITLKLAHAKMLKAISYAKVKTDSVDAHMLAELLRSGLIPESWKTEKRQRELRELTRARLRWLHKRQQFQNLTYSIATRYNLTVKTFDWRNISNLRMFLRKQLPNEAWLEASLSIDQVMQFQESIHRIEKAIDRQLWYVEEIEQLMQIPGIGPVSAWSILAEVGDISRFSSDRQFASYCRLVPGSKDSGGRKSHKSGSKDGNKYLRIAFGQAAIGAYTNHKEVRKFYNKLKRRKGPIVARTIVAKELSRIVWHMLAYNQPYKGFKGQMTKIKKCYTWPHPVSP